MVNAALSSALTARALGLRARRGGLVTQAGSQPKRCTMWILKRSANRFGAAVHEATLPPPL